jgi:predicted MFS family arabinose efflux permease
LLARWTPRALLIASAVISALALGTFIAASSPLVACAALCVLGAAAAPHHALLMAAAYQLVPDRPGVVSALSNALVPLDVLLPLAIGLVASRFGLSAALAALALQPLIVLATALRRSGLRSAQKVL